MLSQDITESLLHLLAVIMLQYWLAFYHTGSYCE